MSRYPSAASSAAFFMAASAVSRRSVTRPQMSVAEIKNDIGGPDRRSLTGRQLKPVTKTNHESEGAKHKLRESESDKAGAKQDETGNGHGEEALRSKFIAHGTPPFACPCSDGRTVPMHSQRVLFPTVQFRAGLMF
jgi:hypothetical protein